VGACICHWESFVERRSTHLNVPFDAAGLIGEEGYVLLFGFLDDQSISTQLWDPSSLENYMAPRTSKEKRKMLKSLYFAALPQLARKPTQVAG
jgi:hypothetical protein